MHVNVQKSTRITLPRRFSNFNGCVLSQPVAPLSDGVSFLIPKIVANNKVDAVKNINRIRLNVLNFFSFFIFHFLAVHLTIVIKGFPFSTIYVASSLPLMLPTFFTEWIVSAGTNKTSPGLTVCVGWPSIWYS